MQEYVLVLCKLHLTHGKLSCRPMKLLLLVYVQISFHCNSFVQIFEIVNLADELLPQLPQGTISLPSCSSFLGKGSAANKPSAGISGKQEDANGAVHEISAREKLLQDQPELLQQFGADLLPVLIQVCASIRVRGSKGTHLYRVS